MDAFHFALERLRFAPPRVRRVAQLSALGHLHVYEKDHTHYCGKEYYGPSIRHHALDENPLELLYLLIHHKRCLGQMRRHAKLCFGIESVFKVSPALH